MSHWHHTPGPYGRTDRPLTRVGVVCLTGLAILLAYSLSGCAAPDRRGPIGGPPMTAAAPRHDTEVPNPFFCPGPPP